MMGLALSAQAQGVGIGTNTPATGAALDVRGTTLVGGRLGIGLNSPDYPLDVATASNLTGRLSCSNPVGTWLSLANTDTGGGGFQFISTGSANGGGANQLLISPGLLGSTNGPGIALNGATRFVGIATNAPLTRLSLNPNTTEPKITLWDGGGATHHYGFGVSAAQLNYHVNNTGASHVFYAGGKNGPDGNSAELLRLTGTGRVGIGQPNPVYALDLATPNAFAGQFSGSNGIGTWLRLLNTDTGGGSFQFISTGSANREGANKLLIGRTVANSHTNVLVLDGATGNAGFSTDNPTQTLEVGATDRAQPSFARLSAGNGSAFRQWDLGLALNVANPNDITGENYDFALRDATANVTRLLVEWNTGRVGIGTTAPVAALHVVGQGQPNTSGAFSFFGPGSTALGVVSNNQPPAQPVAGYFEGQLWATNAVSCGLLTVASDARLKTVLGRSNPAADLALLRQLRITDYQMRDRAAYGSQRFKKVIAQEVEEVFPQAVSQRPGFLPDLYQLTYAQALPGDSLLALTLALPLPAGGAARGQRLKLVLPTGRELVLPLARPAPAGATKLLLRRVGELAPGPVFAFGLEHADVRAVDYEALAMLNVSATQALAAKVAALETQNAALRQQQLADRAQASAGAAAAAAATAALLRRVEALEALGSRASR